MICIRNNSFRLFILFMFLQNGLIQAKESTAVLILNSNKDIERYAQAQSSFKSIIKDNVIEFDLRGKWVDESIVEDIILDDRPTVVYCVGLRAYKLADKLVGDENSIVFSSIINWRKIPQRTNIFGVANELNPGMKLASFSYMFPQVKKIGVLFNKSHSERWIQDVMSRR